MNLLNKFKETAVSVLPIIGIVLVLGLTAAPLDKLMLLRFVFGGILLILGLTIFLLGVDLGIQPLGERCGAELTKKRNLALLLSCAFIIGFIVTAAEPDIQVFGDQVHSAFKLVNKQILTFSIAAGVGIFIMFGLLRSVLNLSLKISILICYLIIFTIVFFSPKSFISIAFDSGGATTGPMTVPFIMALGLGVSTVRSDDKNSFGLTGICSIGPVLAVLIYGLVLHFTGALDSAATSQTAEAISEAGNNLNLFKQIFSPFGKVFPHVIRESFLSIAPLFGLFIAFQIFLLKMTKRQTTRILIGFIYSFTGLTIFLIGVNGGFMQTGAELGRILGTKAIENGGFWKILLICTGCIFGAIIVCAEPAVWVLSEQVEQVSGGTIKRKMLLLFFSLGTALAIGLAMWKAISGIDIRYFIIPGYFISLILMIFSPPLFTGIAFDSGGVASGPLTSTFVLSFAIGAANAAGGNSDSFGVIALVAMMPLITIQIMGIIFKQKQNQSASRKNIQGGTNV